MSSAKGRKRTHGGSAPGRLRGLDAFIFAADAAVAAPGVGRVLDIGVGNDAASSIQFYHALRAADPSSTLTVLDHDAKRVAQAQAAFDEDRLPIVTLVDELTDARTRGPYDVIRAMNVLRSGGHLPGAHQALASALSASGVCFEGTSDATGDVLCVHRLVGPRAAREALLMYASLKRGYAPRLFFDHLPRDLRRTALRIPALAALYATWSEAWANARGDTLAARVDHTHTVVTAQHPELRVVASSAPGVFLRYAPAGGVPSAPSS